MTPEQYPVLEILPELKEKIISSRVSVLQAPPGAGKSTILPLQLMDEPWLRAKKILMLEPRRLAARAVAERMAALLHEQPGERIGYRVRFDSKISRNTKVEVVTEGILTRMIQSDNTLEEYGLIIFDEFHERSLHADLALALTLQVQDVVRDDLRILVMSATLDTGILASVLNAQVITSKGRQFPINLKYAAQDSDQNIAVRVAQTIRKALAEESGDILAFLPGAGEIRRVEQLLQEEVISALVYPLYGDLSFAKQQEALLPRRDGQRKVVLATSIAETSLTIEGIRVVIDSGLARIPRFDPRSGLTRLETVRVTRDSADQRAGRGGRLGPGVCYRLWTQGANLSLVDQRKPEILDADLSTLILELLQWGVKDPAELSWVSKPPQGSVRQAMELLRNLEAVDEKGITSRGRKMLELPTHPRIAHMMLIARDEMEADSVSIATDIAALLEERDPVEREAGADISIRLEVLRKWRRGEKVFAERAVLERIEKLALNWRRLMKIGVDNSAPHERTIGKLLWAAYPERLAQQQGKQNTRYKLVSGRMVLLKEHDPLIREPWICAALLDAGGKEGKVFLAAAVHLEDLLDHTIESVSTRWDNEREMVATSKEKRLGPLLLESRPYSGDVETDKRIDVILEKVRETELRILGNEESRLELQARVLSLHHWRKEEPWPPMTDEFLIETVKEWLGPFLSNVSRRSELERLDLREMLKALLPWELQQKLEKLAPTRIEVPSGSMIKVSYSPHGDPPVIEVRLQEMFGLSDTPAVNEGRTKVKIHLLSPGFKPVQVTQDLRSFWETTYHEVRKELRVRYPRHHWPEDPWTAEAVRGAKRRNSG